MERYKDINFWISPNVRINRIEFAWKYCLYVALMYATAIPFGVFTKNFENHLSSLGFWILILPLTFLILGLITIKQRMNDLNFIRWYHFLLFFFAYVFILILLFKRGKDEANVFGFKA